MASEKTLAALSRKELAQMAKLNKVEGWHSMRKQDLIESLKNRKLTKAPLKKPMRERIQALRPQDGDSARAPLRRTPANSLSESMADQRPKTKGHHPVRLAANSLRGKGDVVRATAQGPHWIYAAWELTAGILDRAESSLGANWHQATPVIRVYDIHCTDEASPAKCCVASFSIQAAIDYWHVPIADPTRTYELQLGYETPKGHFFMLARSATVKLPLPGSPQARQHEEHRREAACHSHSAESAQRFPSRGSSAFHTSEDVTLDVNAELLIVGQASPRAHLTCQEARIPVNLDGRFEFRVPLEEGRQVIPVEAVSPDGCQSRTVVLAIERNTKTLAPQSLNEWDD
jgi:hypothetical protein